MTTPRKGGGDGIARHADFDTIIMTPSPTRTPIAGHDRKLLSLPVRTAFMVGVIFGVLVWELWQAATGLGGAMGTGPSTMRTVISSWQITDQPERTPPEAFLCDMSDERSDVCRMIGDVRIDVVNRKIVLYATQPTTVRGSVVIKPHPLKQSGEYYTGPVTMARDSVQEHIHALARQAAMDSMVAPVTLTSSFASNITALECTHRHTAPAVVFSVGGYNGNGYHTFCDGLVPLFITTQHLKGEVVFGVLDYQGWWDMKYGRIVRALSKNPVLPIGPVENKGSVEADEAREPEVHCFSDVTVGLKLHRPNLCVDPGQMPDGADNHAFVQLAARAYGLPVPQPRVPGPGGSLVLGILHREKTRRLLNEAEVIEAASKMGFELRLLSESLLESLDNAKAMAATQELDALLGVHGAGLSQMTMMRRGTVLIQLVPIGAEWVSESDFGECARQNGMHYIAYNVSKEESSLVRKYDGSHAAFTDPTSVWAKGWEEGSEVFLKQDINLDKSSIRRILEETKRYLTGQ